MEYHISVEKIKKLLVENNCWFETFEHEPVRTSEEAAQVRTGYTLSQGAKALILKIKRIKTYSSSEEQRDESRSKGSRLTSFARTVSIDGHFVMLVIPGDKKFDKEKVKTNLMIKDIRFATEEEVAEITEGIQVGGVPPFGNLFGLAVYVDPHVLQNEKIIFNAGDRRFSIGMKSEDYKRVGEPEVVELV
jgi:prolyl-tRNA editing enzyme YbaK/EbsC (Cys-tRNA(Pro) deacylase)